jgi:hypothetical protein
MGDDASWLRWYRLHGLSSEVQASIDGRLICDHQNANSETAFERSFCYRFFFAFAPVSGIPTQVVKPSVSWAAGLQGIALTVFVEPSGSTMTRPVPVSIAGNGPVEYGVAGPVGPYAPV